MSQSGSIVFFSDRVRPESIDFAPLGSVLETDPDRPATAFLRPAEAESMQAAQSMCESGTRRPRSTIVNLHSLRDIASHCDDQHFVRVEVSDPNCAKRLGEAIANALPSEIRGEFNPIDLSIALGGHDQFEGSTGEWRLFGRSRCSITLFGYGLPKHWDRYRTEVFQVPAIQQFQKDLEALLGPMQTCAYWEF